MSSYKSLVSEKIPKELQESHAFKFLLSIVAEKKIASTQELNRYLDVQIQKAKSMFDDSQTGSTLNRVRSREAMDIDYLKEAKRLADKYL